MNCKVCNKPLDMFNVDLGDIKVHMTCFFDETIPNAPTKTDVEFETLNKKREEAIQKRINSITSL